MKKSTKTLALHVLDRQRSVYLVASLILLTTDPHTSKMMINKAPNTISNKINGVYFMIFDDKSYNLKYIFLLGEKKLLVNDIEI